MFPDMKKLDPRYAVGLTDGEGSFHVNIRKWPKNKNGYSVSAEFSMDLVNDDVEILERLKITMGCGSVIPKRQRNQRWRLQARFHVTNLPDIKRVIIPFFKEHPPQIPTKRADFEIWCKIVDIIDRREHLTEEGLRRVRELRSQFSRHSLQDSPS
jgi:hypothetical protein